MCCVVRALIGLTDPSVLPWRDLIGRRQRGRVLVGGDGDVVLPAQQRARRGRHWQGHAKIAQNVLAPIFHPYV